MAWRSALCTSRVPVILGLRHCSSSFSYRTHTCGELRASHVGSHVTLCGWSQRRRILGSGGVAFLPLSDATGTTQIISQNEDHRKIIESLNPESVVLIEGIVLERDERNINKNMETGEIEVLAENVKVLNQAKEKLPFLTFGKASADTLTDEMKLRERYLEIRRAPLQEILRLRSFVSAHVRQFLLREGFIEVETPTLFKPTPEGAREYLVPTRERGKFYSLVQSPQQFKQLLMVGGIDRYFQFARCYRDEERRSDRQPEFTQIDLEMSFTTAKDIKKLTESLVTDIFNALSYPCPPFTALTYRQAMDTYGTDKPDTRLGMPFQWYTKQWEERVSDPALKSSSLIGFKIPQELLKHVKTDKLISKESREQHPPAGSLLLYHQGKLKLLINKGGSIAQSCLTDSSDQYIADVMGQVIGNNETHILVSYDSSSCNEEENMLVSLGKARCDVGVALQQAGLLELSPRFEFLWITDFPLFCLEQDEQEVTDQGSVVIKSSHHPFTSPVPDQEHLLYTTDPHILTKITAQQYDLVVNGWELGGGSIRIHNPLLQEHIFKNILKTDKSTFTHLLKGLESGCPPHGGIALGLDRLMSVMCHTQSIREVIAFPKSNQGNDLMGGAPATLTSHDLLPYHVTFVEK